MVVSSLPSSPHLIQAECLGTMLGCFVSKWDKSNMNILNMCVCVCVFSYLLTYMCFVIVATECHVALALHVEGVTECSTHVGI